MKQEPRLALRPPSLLYTLVYMQGNKQDGTWFKHIYFTTIGEQLYNYTSPLVGVTANHTHTIVHITQAIMITTMSQLHSKQFALRSKWQIGKH